jgi:hypothetical protein
VRRSTALASLLVTLATGCSPGGGGFVPDDTGFDTGVPSGTAEDLGDFSVAYERSDVEYYDAWRSYLIDLGLFESAVDGINGAFALPYDATVVLRECGMANAFWSPADDELSMCYELIADVQDAFTNAGWDLTDEQIAGATVNTYSWVFFHEMGHALVDMLDLPVTGREEDAVDQFSTVLFVSSGNGAAAVDAALYFYIRDAEPTATALADEHSLNLQRFYNVLCLVYGSDPATYAGIVDSFPDMADRADRCPGEYEQASTSWGRLLEPHTL